MTRTGGGSGLSPVRSHRPPPPPASRRMDSGTLSGASADLQFGAPRPSGVGAAGHALWPDAPGRGSLWASRKDTREFGGLRGGVAASQAEPGGSLLQTERAPARSCPHRAPGGGRQRPERVPVAGRPAADQRKAAGAAGARDRGPRESAGSASSAAAAAPWPGRIPRDPRAGGPPPPPPRAQTGLVSRLGELALPGRPGAVRWLLARTRRRRCRPGAALCSRPHGWRCPGKRLFSRGHGAEEQGAQGSRAGDASSTVSLVSVGAQQVGPGRRRGTAPLAALRVTHPCPGLCSHFSGGGVIMLNVPKAA